MPRHLALMDVTPAKRGSFENYAVELAARLERAGWESVLAFWGPPPAWLREALEAHGAEVRILTDEPEFGGRRDWPESFGRDRRLAQVAWRYARQAPPDVVHLHFCVVFSPLPWVLRLAGARHIVFTEHISLPMAERHGLRSLAARIRNGACMRAMDRALAVSGYVKERLVRSDFLPADKVEVLYNGIDLRRFRAVQSDPAAVRRGLGIPPAAPLILSIGQLIEFKGMHVLIDALARMEDAGVHALIVGEGPEDDRLARDIEHRGLANRVQLLGRRDDIAELLHAADLFVLPSVWNEALGYVIVEAMASGKAVVATRVGGIPEVVEDGVTGVLVEPGNAALLALAAESLLRDPERLGRLGAHGRQVAESTFALEAAIERTMAIYHELAGGPELEVARRAG